MTREGALKNAIVTLEKYSRAKSAVLAVIEEFQETRPPASPRLENRSSLG